MKPIAALLVGMMVLVAAPFSFAAEPGSQGKIRVLLTYGGHGFEEKVFFAMFDAFEGIQYTKAQLPKSASLLKPGLENDYDVIVRYDMCNNLPAEADKGFAELMGNGIGLVSLHHNIGAQNKSEAFHKIIGCHYYLAPMMIDGQQHPRSAWDHDQEIAVKVVDKDHPITRGLADFTIHDEVYKDYDVYPSSHLLLSTDHPKNNPSIAWVHQVGKSRVFFFQLGHDAAAWRNPAYPEIVLRGIRWAAGR